MVLEGTSGDYLLHAPAQSRVLMTVLAQVLNFSKDENSTASLSNLSQCSTTYIVRKLFYFCLNGISYISVCARYLLSFNSAQLRRA